jgi:hypothetical protein
MAVDPRKYGPTRGELVFRLAFSLMGLGLLGLAMVVQGIPRGPAFAEIVLFIGLFFSGSAVWSVRRLLLRLHP